MKLLIIQFSPVSYYILLLRSKYSPQDPVFKRLNLFSLHNVRGQVLHSYKTTEKIIVVHILIFTYLGSRLKNQVTIHVLQDVIVLLTETRDARYGKKHSFFLGKETKFLQATK
jgi:hypothetical protein